jgi:hypothetical protein
VKIGATNETFAQILEGVSVGQELKILQVGEGQELLERAGIRIALAPSAQPGERGPRPAADGPNGRVPGGGGSSGMAGNGPRQGPQGPAAVTSDAPATEGTPIDSPSDAAPAGPDGERPRNEGRRGRRAGGPNGAGATDVPAGDPPPAAPPESSNSGGSRH